MPPGTPKSPSASSTSTRAHRGEPRRLFLSLAEARARGGGASRFGVTPGVLLLETGDVDAAIANLERVGRLRAGAGAGGRGRSSSPHGPVPWTPSVGSMASTAALASLAAVHDVAPSWARRREAAAAAAGGGSEDALADAENLEAIARGTAAKHSVWLQAGCMWQAAGVGRLAGALFERALRFAPDEPAALAGLGSALVSNGAPARGAALLGRALSLAERRGDKTHPIALALARALAEELDDLPSAIAHASAIPADAAEAPVARGLEGRWRALLGDLVGAGLAFAKLRELVATMPASDAEARTRPIASFLVEAARMEREQRRDPRAARRHLAAALRLLPHDLEVRRLLPRRLATFGNAIQRARSRLFPHHSARMKSRSGAAIPDARAKVSFEPDVSHRHPTCPTTTSTERAAWRS